MNSLWGQTPVLATGPLNRPLFSSIQRIRSNGVIFAITAPCSRRRCAMLPPASRSPHSALDLGDPGGRPTAHREVADALAARRHRALEPLAPPRVKEPPRRELVAVGADAHRQGYDRAQARAQPADLRAPERGGSAARIA